MPEETLKAVPASQKPKLTPQEKKSLPPEPKEDDPVAIKALAKILVEHWLKGTIRIEGAHRRLAESQMKQLQSLVVK